MAEKSNFIVRGGLDVSNLTKGLTQTQKQIATFQTSVNKTMSKVGTGIKLALGYIGLNAIKDFVKSSINTASNLAEVQNVVDVTFGNMSDSVNNFAKNALKSYGLSELSAKKYASTMGAILKSSGIAGQSMLKMSETITALSGDMASFYNINQDDAFQKIRAGLTGEVEPLRQLGVNMTVANLQAYALTQGIKKQYEQMSQAEQVLLRYNYLLSVTKDAQGDFARTSGSWANQMRLLTEQWNTFKATLGQGFIMLLSPMIKAINFLIGKLQIAAQYFKAFAALITGTKQQATNTTSSVSAMGNAASGLGKKVKKAGKDVKSTLASFDQLNVLTQSTADAADDAAGSLGDMAGSDLGDLNLGSGNIDLGIDPGKLKPIQDMLNNIKTIASQVAGFFVKNFGPPIAEAFRVISVPLQGWKDAIAGAFTQFMALGEPLKQWFVGDFTAQIQTAIRAIGNVLAGLLDTELMVFKSLKDAAYPTISWFVTDGLPMISQFTIQWIKLFQNMFDSTKSIFDMLWAQGVAPGLTVLSTMIQDTLEIIKGFWDNWGGKIFGGLNELVGSIKSIMTTLWKSFLQPIWQNICDTISWMWSKHLKGLVQELTNFIGKLTTAVLDITNKFITPIVNMLVKTLGPTWSNIFNGIVNVLGTIVATIIDIVKGLIKVLGGLVDFIAGVFTADWKRSWTGIKGIFSGIVTIIGGLFKGVINGIIDNLNYFVGALNNIHIKIPDWSPVMPGKTFGVNIPKIPKLASGGLAYGPTMALIGDNKNASIDPEVVSPLSKLQSMLGGSNQEVVAAIKDLSNLIRNMETPIIIKYKESEFGRAVINAANMVNRQSGYAFEV